MMDAFRRPVYSSLTFKLSDPADFQVLRERIEDDPRLPLEPKREKQYYEEQSEFTATFITWLGGITSVLFGLAAIVGAAITMYAAVANRTREIGTLRALGFSRFSVLTAFMVEAELISLMGGVLGIIAASFLSLVSVSMTNWNTFSSLAFSFQLTPSTVMAALIFAVFMGLTGGFLPAVRAARLQIIDSLRAV
jgi:ABC-type antimicrobial peptide transport system permease subunit